MFDSETYEKCKSKVSDRYRQGSSPEHILEMYDEIYPREMLEQALNEAIAENEDEIIWGVPPTLDGRTEKWNWYKGPNENSKRWNLFKAKLEAQGHIGEETLLELDKSTTRILSLSPAPVARLKFESRGLVMGHVQSGKTTNFLGLTMKAADEGYRLIIVLSGITNNLRDQTQARLEASIDLGQWIMLTDINSDFRANSNNAQALLGNASNRHIAVVKKNKSRLKSLRKWLGEVDALTRNALPVLIIDDECDQATVNAGTQIKRNAINQALQDLLEPSFLPKAAYVGYSATPFANILADTTDTHGIYPRDFIVSLTKAPGYFGAAELFGTALTEAEEAENQLIDIIRAVPNSDVASVLPPKRKSELDAWEPAIPSSLKDAIYWFILATSARHSRGDQNKWSSMMVHTSSNIAPHRKTAKAIKDFLEAMTLDAATLSDLENLWKQENGKASDLEPGFNTTWEQVRDQIGSVFSKLKVITDNSKSEDRLSYAPEVEPYPVIVVGGNTLSRGLTLEGLVSSYFLRTSNAYDSLMQMGRWFGYRPKYADLQRIWLSNEKPYETVTWFRELSFVEEEIRSQIDLYALEGRSPSELGIRIKSLPGMAITAAAKMKSAERAQIGYGRSREQTILFLDDDDSLKANLAAVTDLVDSVGLHNWKDNGNGWPVARDVSSKQVLGFIEAYLMHPDVKTLQKKLLTRYIRNLNAEGELLDWNIAIYSNQVRNAKSRELAPGITVRTANRSRMSRENNLNIKTLISLGDMVADKPELKAKAKNSDQKVNEAGLHHVRALDADTAGKGLLGIYIIDKDSEPPARFAGQRESLGVNHDLVGLFFVFPETSSNFNATYYTPNLAAQETSFEDIDDDPYDEDEEEGLADD
jgi:hypothetical protein